MKKVAILVLEDCTSIAMIGAMELLNKAGVIHQELNQLEYPFFEVKLVALEGQFVKTSNDYPLYCHCSIDQLKETDILLIPALELDVEQKLEANQAFIPHIKRLYEQGTEIGSMCTGAFLLAESGLLDGKRATTHWAMANQFRERFPRIILEDGRLIVDEGRIYTCGGATSFMNLVIYLVEKFCGHETAVMTSKMLLIDKDKSPQSSYAIFNPQKHHQDKAVLQAQHFIESKVTQKISVLEVANFVNISNRNFIRRFKLATGNTPSQYIQRVKIEAVKKALENSEDSIESIIYQIGYEDTSAFRRLFRRQTGLTPQNYRRKYSRSSVYNAK